MSGAEDEDSTAVAAAVASSAQLNHREEDTMPQGNEITAKKRRAPNRTSPRRKPKVSKNPKALQETISKLDGSYGNYHREYDRRDVYDRHNFGRHNFKRRVFNPYDIDRHDFNRRDFDRHDCNHKGKCLLS